MEMELHSSIRSSPSPARLHLHLHRHPKPLLRISPPFGTPLHPQLSSSSSAVANLHPASPVALEHAGGRMVMELVGAFNELTERMGDVSLSTSSSRVLFKALKLAIPILLQAVPGPDGRSPLSRALSIAVVLANLQMDAEVISASILREVVKARATTIQDVRDRVSASVAHLLHESLRVRNFPSKVDVLDEENAAALRKFCLTFYNIRAVILDLALKLDTMRHLNSLPRYQQQTIALEVMKVYAPLAHAVGTTSLSLELEDLSFQYLFPHSYLYIDTWLRSQETGSKPLIEIYKEQLLQSLQTDEVLADMVEDILVQGRYKSRYSTMKKLLKDGRKPEEVNDVLGLRVILRPKSDSDDVEIGERACYRARKIVESLWMEIPHMSKDYIARPKANGYQSLHMAVDVTEKGRRRPLMEIQIRTTEMDMLAVGGTASHSLYKSGLTDPEEVTEFVCIPNVNIFLPKADLGANKIQAKQLKAIMLAAVELAALRLQDFPLTNPTKDIDVDRRDRVFRLMDKNGDGSISIEELMEVMKELGAPGEDAREMMLTLDSNSDGSVSLDEFDVFQKQVAMMRNLEMRDEQYKTLLNEKLHHGNEDPLTETLYNMRC